MLISGTFFSTSRNESVATTVKTPPSIDKYKLANSGRTVDEEAHEEIEEKIVLRIAPEITILLYGFSGKGIEGKSS